MGPDQVVEQGLHWRYSLLIYVLREILTLVASYKENIFSIRISSAGEKFIAFASKLKIIYKVVVPNCKFPMLVSSSLPNLLCALGTGGFMHSSNICLGTEPKPDVPAETNLVAKFRLDRCLVLSSVGLVDKVSNLDVWHKRNSSSDVLRMYIRNYPVPWSDNFAGLAYMTL